MRSIYERIQPSADGRIRSNMNPAGTETGRFSHSDTFLWEPGSTNLGNLPKKMALLDPLYDIRACLVPSPGKVLWEADLSQAEARVAAWMSEDPLAMRQYREGVDRYKYLAAAIYHNDPTATGKVSKSERQVGKMGQLAFQYGVSWRTFMEQVNADADLTGVTIDAKTAKKAEDNFKTLYAGYPKWWARVGAEVDRNGFLVNPFGRKRYFFARSDSSAARQSLIREAVAFLPQSTIADLLNSRMRVLYEEADQRNGLLQILLQVHDAVIGECSPRDLQRVANVVVQTLEVEMEIGGRPLIVPAEFSASSKSWAEMREVKAVRSQTKKVA